MSLFIVFLLAGCLNMRTTTLVPVADVEQVWSQIPSDGLAHYLKVDEGVATPDDASTYLSRVSGGIELEEIRLGPLPSDLKHSVDVRLRARARADTAVALGFLLIVNGVDIYGSNPPDGPGQFFDWSVLPLNTWSDISFSLPFPFPALSGGESIDIALVGTGFTIDVTALELEIDYIPSVPHAQGAGGGPHASGLALPITATPTSGSPRATATSGAARATVSAPNPHGSGD